MPVHLSGRMSKMSEIIKFAKNYKIKVIEDAAQSLVQNYIIKCPVHGDVGCFSAHL